MTGDDLMRFFSRAIKPIKNRIMMLVGRCVLLATTDSEGIQKIKAQVLAGETMEDIERFQNYGMTSNVPDGGEGVIVFPFGNREHGICVVLDNRKFRLKGLAKGEVALFTDEGDTIHMKRGNKIEINAQSQVDVNTTNATVNASGSTTINSPNTTATGNMNVDGNLVVGGNATVTGNTTSANVIGTTAVSAPAIAAATSMTVAGQQLNDYENHTHDYEDDNGSGTTTKTTGSVN